MLQTVVQDDVHKVFYLVLGNGLPQFSCQRIVLADAASGLGQHLADEPLVHGGSSAVSVQMSLSQLDRLAQHDSQRDVCKVQLVGHCQRLTDVVAIFHESLSWQPGVATAHIALALGAAVDDNPLRATGPGHLHTLADALYESLFREGLDDARDADD